MRMRTRILAVLLTLTACSYAQSVGGKIPNQRTICSTAGSKSIGPLNLPSTIPAKSFVLRIEIAGYAGGETAALQFNGDAAANYSVIWASWNGAAWAAGANTAAGVDRIRIGPSDVTTQRIVTATVHDNSAKQEHMVVFDSATGTGANTQSTVDVGNGKWFSAVATAITSVTLITTNANMGSGTCITASW